jgi:tripartite-type tricarboxylate transporter receptor subunit TctC
LYFRQSLAIALVSLASLAVVPAGAQTFPSKQVRIVVPFPPGGGVDVLIRAVAVELSARWGQPVIVDNRAGAGGVIGSDNVAKAAPDGYVLLATINQTVTSNRFLYRSLPYDPDHAFTPISIMVQSDQLLVANPKLPAEDLRGLIALAKSGKEKLAYGSFGGGSQPNLIYELLKSDEKLDIVHVPYKGVAPAITALMGGDIQLSTASAGVGATLIRAGKIKALAVAGKQRSSQFPEVPTTAEQGHPDLLATTWYAVLGPAGMSPSLVQRINTDISAVLRQPAFAERNATSKGLDVVAGGPAELAAAIKQDLAFTAAMVKAANIQPE